MIEAVHTPGHRPEHTSFLLRDRSRGGEPWAVLTGDSLFVGDVARPDLAIEPRDGAREIFASLHDRLFSLPDSVEVWPGHLGGSTCGSAGDRPQDVVDHRLRAPTQPRRGLDASRSSSSDAVAGLGDRPPNVEHVVALNRGPAASRSWARPRRLSPRAVEGAIAGGAILVDARTNEQFDEAHIPGAISASAYDTGFATKVARVVPAGYRADRRRRLRRLRARGCRAPGGGRPGRPRLPRGRDDRLALGGAAGRADRADRRRTSCASASRAATARWSSTSGTPTNSRPAHPRLRAHPLRRARRSRWASCRPTDDRDDLQRRQALRARGVDPPARGLRARASTSATAASAPGGAAGRPIETD